MRAIASCWRGRAEDRGASFLSMLAPEEAHSTSGRRRSTQICCCPTCPTCPRAGCMGGSGCT
eukprot:4805078-Prymnesium_polylepis.1